MIAFLSEQSQKVTTTESVGVGVVLGSGVLSFPIISFFMLWKVMHISAPIFPVCSLYRNSNERLRLLIETSIQILDNSLLLKESKSHNYFPKSFAKKPFLFIGLFSFPLEDLDSLTEFFSSF